MSQNSPLNDWRFLVGNWKGKAEDEFGEKGITESVTEFSMEPSEKFITGKGESWNQGRLVNRSITFLFYDNIAQKFRRKSFFSYGFVNNEVEYTRSKDEIRFNVEVEPNPKQFEGIRWRSYMRKSPKKKWLWG